MTHNRPISIIKTINSSSITNDTTEFTITNNSSKDGNITKGIVTFKYNDYVYDINYTIEKNITLDNYDFTNSSSINDLTNIDTSKLESAIEVIRESNLIKSLLNLYQELS